MTIKIKRVIKKGRHIVVNTVTNSNREQVILNISNGNISKMLLLQNMSNTELQNLLANPEKINEYTQNYYNNKSNVFDGNIANNNYNSMDGLVVEQSNLYTAEAINDNETKPIFYSNCQNIENISDEEVLKMWNSMPKYVQDLYYTYLNNLSEAERVEAEKGFLDNIRDFFTTSFKLMPYIDNPAMMCSNGDAWKKGVEEAFTTSIQKKLKKDEQNIKQLANLSINFDQNINEIKSILKNILGIEVTDEEIRANKDKLLQIAELSKNFDANLADITDIFKEITGIDVLEEDLLKNKDNIDKLNQQSTKLEQQYDEIKAKYKEITGKELTDEEFEKLLNGESQVSNEEFNALLQEYQQGYEEFAETASDAISGVASFGAFVGGTAAGGPAAGYAAAVATGAGIKYAMKRGNSSNKSEGYTTGAADLITGGVGGLFNTIAPQVGSAAARAVFNRGGAELLKKVTIKSANKALPNYLNKAVSLDNKYLGASKVQHITARYMQAAVEGTVAITPYNISSELTANEENKQGWGNVATNSIVGGLLFGPVIDLGFRFLGKHIPNTALENTNNFTNNINIGSPANAIAYQNIEVVSSTEFNVNVGGKTVKIQIPHGTIVNPAQVYTAACNKLGISSKAEILKTLGLMQLELPSDPTLLRNFVNNSPNYNNVVLSASDGTNTYNVKVNNDGTVTLSTLNGSQDNFSVYTETISVDEFINEYNISAYSRETMPKYISDENLDKLADKSNILITRNTTDESSEEILIESIDKKNKTVTVKRVISDRAGNIKTEKVEMSYDDFTTKFQYQRQLDDVLNYIHNIAQKYNYDEKTLREYVFKGLDINHPVFQNEKTTIAYIQDFFNTANLKAADGSPLFSRREANKNGAIYQYYDTNTIQYFTALKYSNPELKTSINKLISLVQNGAISSKELRNITTLLDYGVISESTIEKILDNPSFIKEGSIKFTSIIDDTAISGTSDYLDKIQKTLGAKRYNELKTLLGDKINNVHWELTEGMNSNELFKFVEDIKTIYQIKNNQVDPENFFINIDGYGKNVDWAKSMQKTTDYASTLIKKGKSLDEVLDAISNDTRQLDLTTLTDPTKIITSGISREQISRSGAYTPYSNRPYNLYKDRFDKIIWKDERNGGLHNPYPDIELTRIGSNSDGPCMMHPPYHKEALEHVDNIYKEIQDKYMGKKLTQKDLQEINEKIAEMHWILAHSMPWARGSDCIANAFVKSVYEALGIKTYPPAKNISFDLEAFCTELSDYKKRYAGYYSKPPEIRQ